MQVAHSRRDTSAGVALSLRKVGRAAGHGWRALSAPRHCPTLRRRGTRMRVVASGYVFDARDGSAWQRSCEFTAVTRLKDGTLLVTCRRGSARESIDGHVCVFASTDEGATWEERYDG